VGRRLTTQQRIKRARAEGFSRKQLASAFGVSVSTIGRAERGAKRTTIEAQAAQFYKLGKRAKQSVISGRASLSSAKSKAVAKIEEALPIVTPLERAEGHLSQLPGGMWVVVHLTMGATGMSRTLWARGGIQVREIRGRLKAAIDGQAARQGRNEGSESPKEIDWDDVTDITIEEY